MAEKVVVDTNVGIAANGCAGVTRTCELACVNLLETLSDEGHLVLDDGDRIFDEYRRYLSLAGQPGVGDLFMKWVNDNRHNPDVCTTVGITPLPHDELDFKEFPRDPALTSFDRSDRKFVAVASAHPGRPPVFAATDRGWQRHQAALAANGVSVTWLGP